MSLIMNQTIPMPDPEGAHEYFHRKIYYSTGPVELSHALDAHENINVVDVREAEDFQKGHVPGSVNLPRDRWASHEGLRKDVPNVLLCYSQACHLAAKAGHDFAKAGFPVLEMDGGWAAWQENELPAEKGQASRATSLQQ
ncbi:MAG TPA: rhodanese-like domain-containing protein [Candidatus Acidoferrum sp.]|nr:rhodanese-like domain-containing protein [Candidatus Acidoferrum sp.]